MTGAQHQTRGQELLKNIEGLLYVEEESLSFALRRLRKEAENLANASAVDASVAKAGLAAHAWDFDEARYWINNSLSLEKSTNTYINAAVSARLMNDFAASVEYARQAARLGASNSFVVLYTAKILMVCGYYSEALALMVSCPAKDDFLHQLETCKNRIKHLNMAGISENHLQLEIEAATGVARRNKKRIMKISHVEADDREDGLIFVLEIVVKCQFKDCLMLEAELSGLQCDMEHWDPVKLSVEFKEHELQPQ